MKCDQCESNYNISTCPFHLEGYKGGSDGVKKISGESFTLCEVCMKEHSETCKLEDEGAWM